jgi:uncharacterized membrane protein
MTPKAHAAIPKLRLDALTDGVFAVAMTLLVIDLRLPEGFTPRDGRELVHGLSALGSQALVYVVSFYVLGLRWFGIVRSSPRGEEVNERYTRTALINLLLTTFVPFTTMVVGRYPSFVPAVWGYAVVIILLAVTALRMISLEAIEPGVARKARISLSILILAAVVTMVISLIAPKRALVGYLVNLIDEPLRRLMRKRAARSAHQ